MSKLTRESAKSSIRSKVTVATGHVHSLKHSDDVVDKLFDQHEDETSQLRMENDDLQKRIEELEAINKAMGSASYNEHINRIHSLDMKVKELEKQLSEHKRLHDELNTILHKGKEAPKNPSLCDLVSYVKHDLEQLGGEVVAEFEAKTYSEYPRRVVHSTDESSTAYAKIDDYILDGQSAYKVMVIKQKGE
jgi:phosphoglycerate-specific signal transduction histidine kinase